MTAVRGVRLGAALGLFAIAMACGGLPAGTPSLESGEGPRLLTLEPADGACSWRVWQVDGAVREVGQSAGECPDQILWDPSGGEVVSMAGQQITRAPWLKKGEAVAVAPTPLQGDGAQAWIAADTGRLRVAVLVEAVASTRGTDSVFTVGELSAVVVGGEQYGVRGTEVVAPGAGDRDVFLPPWGLDAFAVFFDHGDQGWTQVAALPTRYAAGETPGMSVGGPLLDTADWPSLSSFRQTCATGQDCAATTEWQERAELRAAVEAEPDDEVGFAQSEPGGWLFKVMYGDSPHAFAPVLWCGDPDCDERVALEGVSDGQLSLQVHGGYLLVGSEFTGAGPRVYAAGRPEAVLDVPKAAGSAWLPSEGLPGLD